MNIDEAFEYASVLHGHKCPGLAIGVRAAEEAKQYLGLTVRDDKALNCIAESRACYIDGIQALTGCTMGKSNLQLRPTGKTAFSFYHSENGSVRFLLRELPAGTGREEKIAYILHAPLEAVFTVGVPRVPFPPYCPAEKKSCTCSVCGEALDASAALLQDGQPVCLDCAEL